MLNSISVVGTITEKVTVKQHNDLDIAHGVIKIQGGSRKRPRDIFLEITAFGKQAVAFGSMSVGTIVGVTGRLDTNYWRDKNDKDIFVVAENIVQIVSHSEDVSTPESDGDVPF